MQTFNGTARFDGVRFAPLPRAIANAQQHFLTTKDGRDWYEDDALVFLGVHRAGSIPGSRDLMIRELYEDANGDVYVGANGLLARIPAGTSKLEIDPGLRDLDVLSILRDRRRNLWVGTSKGLFRRVGDAWVGHPQLSSWATAHLVEDREGRIWAGGLGVYVLDAEDPRRATLVPEIPSGQIRAILEDSDGILWIATAANGLVRHWNGRFDRMGLDEGLPSKSLRDLHEDDQGNLWIGTAAGGLVRLSDGPFVTFGQAEGLRTAFAFTAIFDRNGDLWVGTNGGGVSRLRGGKLVGTYAKDEVVLALLETADGRILAGARSGLLEKRGQRFVPIRDPAGITALPIRSLLEDDRGAVWLGGNWGLAKWSGGTFTRFPLPDVAQGTFRSMRRAPGGGIWVCTRSLVHVEGNRARVVFDPGPNKVVRDAYRDENGVLWLATSPGLARVEGARVSWFHVPAASDQAVHTIVADEHGRFWLPTNAGLVRVARAELDAFAGGASPSIHWRVFDESDGLASSEFNGSFGARSARDADGRFWLPSVAGVVSFNPQFELPPSNTPATFESAQTGDGTTITKGERLPPQSRNRIEFRYTALDLTSPEQMRFRYRLDPIDGSWTDAESVRLAIYRNLKPGTYRFRVAAAGRDRVFREADAPFELTIERYFYERTSVRIAAAALALAVVVMIPFLRGRRLRRRQIELQRLVEERTSQLTIANERLEATARTDPLTGILNRRGFLERTDLEIARFRRHERPFSIVLLDLDHFKAINDRHGHAAGDAVIRAAASLVLENVRDHEPVARWGGEEIIILLAETGLSDAMAVAEKLREAIARTEVPHEDLVLRFTATIGVAEFAVTDTIDACIHRSDEALYEGKAAGRNRVTARLAAAGHA